MDLKKLKSDLESDLASQRVSSKILLNKFILLDEDSKKTMAYTDPKYMPFYYYLGKIIQAKNIVEIGFNLGLSSGCFLQGSTDVENLLVFQQKSKEEYYPRLAYKNIKNIYKKGFYYYYGNVVDEEFTKKLNLFKWDVIIVNEQLEYDAMLLYFDVAWQHLCVGGLIVSDYVNKKDSVKEAFDNFCKIKNRKCIKLDTRYGIGIVER